MLLDGAVDAELFEAESHHAALTVFHTEEPDVVILDLNIPGAGGLDLLRRFLTERPQSRILIFSMHGHASYVMKAMQAGAYGYVTKSASATELLEAIGKVMAGARYLQRDLVTELAGSSVWTRGSQPPLTTRELDILRLLAEGNTLAEIAAQLAASYKTIANACTGIKEKLMVERTADLIRVAIEMNAR